MVSEKNLLSFQLSGGSLRGERPNQALSIFGISVFLLRTTDFPVNLQ